MQAAVMRANNAPLEFEEVQIAKPGPGEVLVKTAFAGLCHSDEHLVTGDIAAPPQLLEALPGNSIYPMIGGHEGSGVVVEVGAGVTRVAVGDHVACSFVPSCGSCRSCARGQQNLCDLGAGTLGGGMVTDGTYRTHLADGRPLGKIGQLGTFAEHMTVAEASLVRVEPDLPLDAVALVSCGVATGFGSATNRADVRPGDTVVVVGCGGVRMNAVQGAAAAGASTVVAVDPVEFKREVASSLGATHVVASLEDAWSIVNDATWGRMADAVILTPGVLDGAMIQPAFDLTAKGGTVVATALGAMHDDDVKLTLAMMTLMQKELRGTVFGAYSPGAGIPELLRMYQAGTLKLDELITRRYALDDINLGYDDMRSGRNIRGVIDFEL